MKRTYTLILAFAMSVASLNSTYAGKIVVSNDEWWHSDTGFGRLPDDACQFAKNIAAFFTGGASGTFHAYSTNFSLTGSALPACLAEDGHTYSTGLGIPFDEQTLSSFDALFFAGNLLDATQTQTLIDYVKDGGNVYIAGGTSSNAPPVAAAWNLFLNEFGVSFVGTLNGLLGNIDVSSGSHPIFNSVQGLYHDQGSPITGEGIVLTLNEQGAFAVIDMDILLCGDDIVDPGEECDDGILNSDTTPDACRTDCTLPVCGDTVTDPGNGEECDDGNTEDGDGCSSICQREVIGPLCLGEPATDGCTFIIDGIAVPDQPCVGTPDRDVIFGTDGPDVISGLGGNDIIKGRGGDDLLCGDAGRDNLHGNDGNDTLDGGDNHDNLQGNKGFDTCLNGENIKKGCEVVM